MSTTRHIYMVRHGETDMNRNKRLQGRIDCELNNKGIADAKASYELFRAAGISFDKVYSSPLKRAVKTAEIISGGKDVIPEPLIIEMDFGSYEGIHYSGIDEPMWDFFHDPENAPAPDGVEHTSQLTDRTGRFIERLLNEEDENVLIVTHGIALRSLLRNLSDGADKAKVWSLPITNCIVYHLTVENGKPVSAVYDNALSVKVKGDTSGAF